ncbi:nucleoside transporter-domain-containing protein [Hyaloraphidium curvatum]|nr:nucleoside transporter-domain-containing protein [Hyaloraphidium curvatum]
MPATVSPRKRASVSSLRHPVIEDGLEPEWSREERTGSLQLSVDEHIVPDVRPFSLFAYVTFLLLGASMLMPWNSMINSTGWLRLRLEHTRLLGTFLNWIGLTNTWVTLFVGLVAYSLQRPPKAHSASRVDAIQVSLFTIAAVFVVSALLTLVPLDPYVLFGTVILLLTISTVAAGVLQLDVFALVAAEYPPVYMQAIAIGQVLAAIAMSIFSMSAVALDYLEGGQSVGAEKKHKGHKGHHGGGGGSTDPPVDEPQGRDYWIYFSLCCLPVLVTMVCYSSLRRRQSPLPIPALRSPAVERASIETDRDSDVESESGWNAQENEALIWNEAKAKEMAAQTRAGTWQVLWDLRYLGGSLFLCFAVTLALYPALTATVLPAGAPPVPTMYDRLFVPLGFLCSGIGDWIGRSIPAVQRLILTSQPTLLLLALLRVAFLFVFAACNLDFSGAVRPPRIPTVFAADGLFFTFVGLFFVSHGYLSTVALMLAPGYVSEKHPHAKRSAGALMSLILFFGLAVGSATSFAVRWFIFGAVW